MQHFCACLKNGVRVIIVPMLGNPTITIFAGTDTGSLHEDAEHNGISHFLEHLYFKGSTNHSDTQKLLEELDVLGTNYNAFTSYETTACHLTTRSVNAGKAIDLVSDLYINQLLRSSDIENERGVICGEIDMYNDDPGTWATGALLRIMYGDQPAGRSVLGTKENVERFSRSDFVAYRKANYTAETTFVVIAGGISIVAALQMLESSHFAGIARASRISPLSPHKVTTGLTVEYLLDSTEQTHICLGFEAHPVGHADTHIVRVINAVFSGGMSARIFRRMRTELGLGYDASGSAELYRYYGMYGAAAGVDSRRAEVGIYELARVCMSVARERVSDRELTIAREVVANNVVLETSDQVAGFYAGQEINGLPPQTPEEKLIRINTVTADDILRVAGGIFTPDNLHVVVVGPEPRGDPSKLFQNL